jgi:hypothetical protein
MSDNEIIVYYSFCEKKGSNKLDNKPISLRKYFISLKDEDNLVYFCPAIIERLKNIFYFNSLEDFIINKEDGHRKTKKILKDTYQIILNYNLFLFCEEPLTVLISDPFFHNRKYNGFLAVPSMFDIGQKFRPIEFSFFVFSEQLKILKDEPLLYLEFITDKKIVFKEFEMSNEHVSLLDKQRSKLAMPKYLSLKDRYLDFKDKRENLITLFKGNEYE